MPTKAPPAPIWVQAVAAFQTTTGVIFTRGAVGPVAQDEAELLIQAGQAIRAQSSSAPEPDCADPV